MSPMLSGQFCWFRAYLQEGGGTQVGEVTRLSGVTRPSIQSFVGSPHLSCKRDQIKIRDYMDRRVTPPKRVTSPTWGPPPPCKQPLSFLCAQASSGNCEHRSREKFSILTLKPRSHVRILIYRTWPKLQFRIRRGR